MGRQDRDLEEIFHRASEITETAERAAYVEEACSGDPELRSEVEFLLKSDDEAGDFLEIPAIRPDVKLGSSVPIERPGAIIGRYRLLEKIGEGGMAAVYMAEQQHPIQRKVALKLLKLGMNSEQVIARFEAERQALALMDHPHIAKVFDAGATESGRPYFVMELVKGISITQFCDRNRLNAKARLSLFVCVCQAVHHAHQKGVIHRDIKPSNVMVTLHDGRPVPKVIDFGIAKATNQRLTEKTLFTHYAQIIGTPEYMSPEQAEMSGLDVDTRSDVYSLGVLLYELLTGSPPFEVEYLRSKGYAEIQRIIREEEPTKPSTKISTLGEAIIDIADMRSTTPDALRRLMRADLDWIVMKALEKDRTRRYDSARDLTLDIERHLKNEPVLAGPPSVQYRTRKFLKRNRTPVTLLLAVAIALVIGSFVSTSVFEIKARSDRQLSTVKRLYAEGRHQAALKEIEESSLDQTKDATVELLRARLLCNVGRQSEAKGRLKELLDGPQHIAGAAHYLLSRITMSTDPIQAQVHREQADSLSPPTADGHALRALTAGTPDEALQWLDQALALDPSHYTSRETRAFVYYGMREYVGMQVDAEAIIVLRPQYYLGYALRALARSELSQLEKAMSDHNRAIELCDVEGELAVLYHQRQETYWRLGDHGAALQDARHCVTLDPQSQGYRASLAKILFALRQYEQAKQEFDHLAFQGEATWLVEMSRYMSDAISAGESLEMPEDVLQDWSSSWVPASLLLPTTADLFRMLGARANRLVCGSLDVSSWSPDGNQLVYTRSEHYRWDDKALQKIGLTGSMKGKGIEIRDLETGRTRVLVRSGSTPAWSPDGRFVAFVRSPSLYRGREEIWLIPAQGGTPQRLVAGSCPSWTNHPTRLYFVSATDEMLCYVDVNHPTVPPTHVAPCPGWHMQMSPDERHLAYVASGELTIVELATGEELVQWVVPGPGLNFVRWSPDGKEVSLGFGQILRWPSGLWIFDVERKQGRHVLDPMALSCNWSPDRSRLAVDLGYPMNEIWLAEVDPNLPTWEALGGGQTRGEYLRRNWHKHIQSSRRAAFHIEVLLRNIVAIAVNQYELGQYDDALWTLQHTADIPKIQGTLAEAKTLAYMAMTLEHLERHEESRQILNRLRVICAKGEITDEACLYEAEKALAGQDRILLSTWEFIQDGQLNQALDLLEDMKLTQLGPAQAERLQSVRRALARAFYLSTPEALHQGHEPRKVLTGYEAALHADADHVPALRDLSFLLATCADAGLRDGEKAKLYAQKACELSAYQDYPCLVSLAAASAECGDFSEAVKWQREALKHLPEGWSGHELVARLKLYERGRHLHIDRVEPLVAWWPLTAADADGRYVQDASGHGLRGKLIGDAKVVTDPNRGHVLSLDGQGDWLDCGQDARYNFVCEISISMWIKVKTFGKSQEAIITKGDNAWEFLRRPFGGMVGFHCQGLDVQSGAWGVLVGSKDVDDGHWHHLTGVYTGTMIYQYVDGELDASAPARGRINLDNGPVYLGNSRRVSSDEWNGLIDDVRIYNRALSNAEIKALYNDREP